MGGTQPTNNKPYRTKQINRPKSAPSISSSTHSLMNVVAFQRPQHQLYQEDTYTSQQKFIQVALQGAASASKDISFLV